MVDIIIREIIFVIKKSRIYIFALIYIMNKKLLVTFEPSAASLAKRTASPLTLLPAPTLLLASDVDLASGRG